MDDEELKRLNYLYKKSGGGHRLFSEEEFGEYAGLRKKEYLDAKGTLIQEGKVNIRAVKDCGNDIIGWESEDVV